MDWINPQVWPGSIVIETLKHSFDLAKKNLGLKKKKKGGGRGDWEEEEEEQRNRLAGGVLLSAPLEGAKPCCTEHNSIVSTEGHSFLVYRFQLIKYIGFFVW